MEQRLRGRCVMRTAGILSLAGALVAVVVYFGQAANLPDAATCAVINGQNKQLGLAATCHSSPGPVALIVAAVFALLGVVLLVAAPRGR